MLSGVTPISWMRVSLESSVRSGASSWQGTHHDDQTFTMLTLPLKDAGSASHLRAIGHEAVEQPRRRSLPANETPAKTKKKP